MIPNGKRRALCALLHFMNLSGRIFWIGWSLLEIFAWPINYLPDPVSFNFFLPHCRDLTLHRNAWDCDCRLYELKRWLENFTVPHSIEPRCLSPKRLHGTTITNLSKPEFACVPQVSPSTMYLEVIEGKNMSLVCNIRVRTERFLIHFCQNSRRV